MSRIIKGILEIKNVYQGWKKHLLKEPLTFCEKQHLIICSKCDNMKEDEWFDLVDDEITDCNGKKCGVCECPILTLIKSNKKCPIENW